MIVASFGRSRTALQKVVGSEYAHETTYDDYKKFSKDEVPAYLVFQIVGDRQTNIDKNSCFGRKTEGLK